jgi:hypothetical protein
VCRQSFNGQVPYFLTLVPDHRRLNGRVSGLLEAVLVLMLVTDERNSSSPIVRRDGVQM